MLSVKSCHIYGNNLKYTLLILYKIYPIICCLQKGVENGQSKIVKLRTGNKNNKLTELSLNL